MCFDGRNVAPLLCECGTGVSVISDAIVYEMIGDI